MAHDHDHSHATARTPSTSLGIAAALTAIFCVVEFVAGWLSGSLSLSSDAGHMLIDFGSMAFVLFSFYLSKRPPNQHRTYGYYRLEILAALLNGGLLFFVAFEIIRSSLFRFQHPGAVEADIMLYVSIAGLLVNIVCIKLLHTHHHHIGTKSVYYHVLSDLLSSIGVIVAAVCIKFFGWSGIDPIIGLCIAALILWNAKKLISDAIHILLESVPETTPLSSVKEALMAVEGVQGIHDLHIWTIGSGFLSATAHLVVFPMNTIESEQIVRKAAKELKHKFGITHSTFQVECIPPPRPISNHGNPTA